MSSFDLVTHLLPLLQLIAIVVVGVVAVMKIQSTTAGLITSITELTKTTARLEVVIDKLIEIQNKHEVRITVLETLGRSGWDTGGS